MSLAARVLNPRPVVTATLDALRDRITRVWRCRETDPDAWAALQSHPQLWNDKGVVLDLAYEEYFLRENAGQALDSEVFCERFAPYRSSLRKLIHAHQWLTPHLDKLEEPPPPAEAIRWPETGETIGDFTLLRELGRGSFARVFLAVEARAGNRKVVIKLTAHSGDEAHTLGQLDHPNIVPLLSAPWIAETKLTAVCMPYMGAATLHDLIDRAFPLRDSPPPRFAEVIVEAARSTAHPGDPQPRSAEADPHLRHDTYVDGVLLLGAQLAEALAYVHERGVLHSDLKPSNVLLSPDGRPLLIDFNLSTEPRTLEARQGGTLPYMAPEQLHAFITETPVNLDAQSDLFSLGVLLYELLTGKLPYGPLPASCNSYDLAALLLKRQKTGFVPICHHNPDVSHFGARMVEQCLAFDAANRPSSAAALAEELRRYFKPAAKRYRWVVRNVVALICAVCVLLISMGTAAVGLAVRDSAAVREARQAKAAMENGEFARAVEHFSGAIAANPEQSSAWFDRGQARLHWSELLSGKEAAATIEEALADFKRSKKLQPDTGDLACDALHRRGQLACKQGDYTLAEQCFSGVLESDHCRFTVWFDRGRVRVKQAEASESHEATKKWAEALDDFTCALELKKGDGATLACLAYCSSRKNNYATAVALYDRALDAKFPAARLLNNRARCLLLSPQHNDPMDVNGAARKNLDDALSQEPGLRAALCNRALLAMNQWLCNPETTISDMVFHDLKNAIELGALSGEFFELAAIASAASTSRASFKDWDALKRQTLDYLSLAVAYGKDRTRLATNPILAHLVSAEEFEALSNIKPTREKDVPLSRLLWVDPVDD